MPFFAWMLIVVLVLECLLSFWWLRRLCRHLHHPVWRVLLLLAATLVGMSLVWFVASRLDWLPKVRFMTALGMLWAVLAVPLGVVPCLLCWAVRDVIHKYRVMRQVARDKHAAHPAAEAASFMVSHWTRRQMLASGLAAAPLALTYGAVGVSVAQAWNFRRRRLDVPVPGLPVALHGLRVLHISDTHVGGFTPAENLDAIAKAVAEEKPELILFTGDLIDHSNRDLPTALAFCDKLRRLAPLYFCEGNHDRIDDADALRAQVRAHGFDWLTEGDARTLVLRGEKVQVFGASWCFKAPEFTAAVAQAAANRDATAFPLLMVHHPDAFDAASAAGFPVVFSGHTHGGQLMLTEKLGAGSVMFNYWSGLYRKPSASLVVSNGVGHWFPLRINAPAEIDVLTLVRG